MIENIKRIGLFMIVAQTFIHFAAGRQYEKYMKIIAGVIVLLLFAQPFVSRNMDFIQQWQLEMNRMTEQIEQQNRTWKQNMPDMDHGTESDIIRRFEEEIKTKLNREVHMENCLVTDVVIKWENGDQSGVWDEWEKTIGSVRVILLKTAQEDAELRKGSDVDSVFIEKIQVDVLSEKEEDKDAEGAPDGEMHLKDDRTEKMHGTYREKETGEYRRMFAEVLGIEEEQVEVIYGGGR